MNDIIVGSKEWLNARRKFITATDACILMGVSKWKSPEKLKSEKLSGEVSPQNYAMKRGHELEEPARRCFEDIKGVLVAPKFITKDDWMAASVDGINEEGVLVEIKSPGDADHAVALRGEIPNHYYPQCQWQMEVCGLNSMFYFSYRPNDIEPCACVEVSKDQEYIQKMLSKARPWWEELMKSMQMEET